ncbi:hypothetical protein ACCI51_13440 [Microbulbifer echini]|uniref:Uncharacterized protein n=1 Tax=Microbulbifer echini TaxID=1529067 RepID=A0ABV4NQ85_9GAMM
MKIVYLDQLHWIEVAKHINGASCKPGTREALSYMKELSSSKKAVFPLSLSHYYETLKHLNHENRKRLAETMKLLSHNFTIASTEKIVAHECRKALAKLIKIDYSDQEFNFLGKGFEHALGKSFGWSLSWPTPELIPEDVRLKIENDLWNILEEAFLSGVLKIGNNKYPFHKKIDFSPENKFKAHLEEWKGCASSMTANELQRKIYSITFTDIYKPLCEAVYQLKIPLKKLENIGDKGAYFLLNAMPTRKVDMHLREQWAKNGQLKPKQSDLNDWIYIGAAICY